jgi:hypothetical protein
VPDVSWKHSATLNDPTHPNDRRNESFATVSPADVSNRFDACCMLYGSRETSTSSQSVRGIESGKANESHEDFLCLFL